MTQIQKIGIRKVFTAFEKGILALDDLLNKSTTKTQFMEITRDRLETKYNQGLGHGSKHVRNKNFGNVYNRLLQDRKKLAKPLYDAFQAGLQDGYHHHGKSHFDEWYRYEYLPNRNLKN